MLRIVVDRSIEADARDLQDALGEGQPFERAGPESEATSGPASWTSKWPENLDEVPQWRLDAERRAADIGASLVNYRTRRDFDAAIAACEARLRSGLRKIKPKDAARMFMDSVRSLETVTFSNATLSDAFEEFCASHGVTCSENFFRNDLKRQPGCRKDVVVSHQPRRTREVTWVIEPATVSRGNLRVSTVANHVTNRVA